MPKVNFLPAFTLFCTNMGLTRTSFYTILLCIMSTKVTTDD